MYLQSYLLHTSTVCVCQRFVNFRLHKNKYPHKAAVGNIQPAQLPPLFKYFCQSQFLSLRFRASVWRLLSLLSAVRIVVVIRHLATKSLYFASLYIAFFSRCGYCRFAALVFTVLVAVLFFIFQLLSAISSPVPSGTTSWRMSLYLQPDKELRNS